MVAWLTQAKINIWNRALKAVFCFTKGILARNIVSPQANICGRNSLNPPPSPHFFSDPLRFFSKFGTETCPPPSKKTGRRWYCGDWFNKITKNLSRSCQMCIWRLLIIVEFVDGGVVLGLPPSFSVVRLRSWWFSHKDELIYFDISSSSQQRICESLLFDDKIK